MLQTSHFLILPKMALNIVLASIFLWPCALPAQENISVREGSYEVFYSAFNTSFLTPKVASSLGIVRGDDRGLLNVSVLEHFPDGSSHPIAAKTITGSSYDLLHRRSLNFQEVVETDARYYLAPFKITNDNEMIIIQVDVTPVTSDKSIAIKLERRFFHN
jgi:hypothetical protein